MGFWRSRWAAIGAAVAVAMGGGGVGLVGATASSGERPVTVTVEPTRILDTRVDLGLTGRFVNETPRDLQVTGDVSIAPSGTATVVPAGAVAVLVNVTVVFPDSPGFLALRPGGAAGVPSTSNVNWLAAGAIEPNAATVDLAGDGTMQVYVKTASPTGTAHVLVDVVGYTVDHNHDDRYYTETEVDSLIAGLGGDDYENVIVVAKSGGHFTSVTSAMNAIGVDPDYPAASDSNRYLVFVAPGVYENEDVDMQPYVDIEGSGEGVTVLTSVRNGAGFGPAAATLVGADNSELRHITVEASGLGGNWAEAIYTDAATSFEHVTATSTGGQRARGIAVGPGGRALMIDVVMVANGASSSSIGLDVFQGVVFADGVFVDVAGGIAAKGILISNASSEVQIENVTTHASGGTSDSTGVEVLDSSATIEGLRSIVIGESTTYGLLCTGAGRTVRVLEATVYSENTAPSGDATGARANNCDLDLRNAVLDAVAAGGQAFGVNHAQTDTVTPANLTIADVESRAESAGSSSSALAVTGSASAAGTFGRVTELNARSTGGSQSFSSWGVLHSANGEVQYRGLSIIVGGPTNFMYGVQTSGNGRPRFDDVVIDAIGEAESTIFGAEFLTDDATLTNARVTAINFDNGTGHDAVGVKANGASGVSFTDVTAYAEAESNTWGAHVDNGETELTRLDTHAVSAVDGSAYGLMCSGGSTTVTDSVLRADSANFTGYGLQSFQCDSTVRGVDMLGAGGITGYGFYGWANPAGPLNFIRDSYMSGSSASLRTVNSSHVEIIGSQLDGPSPTSSGLNDTHECTAVTSNSTGSEVFQTTTADCTTL